MKDFCMEKTCNKTTGNVEKDTIIRRNTCCRCMRTCRVLASFLTLCCVCFYAYLVESDSMTHWVLSPPSSLFSSSRINSTGCVNIDKCALQECLLPCSSPMPQTNEFLKTASIKPQARSIDHRVDFISAVKQGFVTYIASTQTSCQAAFHSYWASVKGSKVIREQSNNVCPVTQSDIKD